MALSREDLQWMQLAARLARRGYPAPNPRVGACIVKDGELVGYGYHPYAGAPHAEIFALQQAGEQTHGAVLYVTLEPCCHYGRTPPCTQAVLKAGVARVVVGMTDPNPKVGGQGIQQLRQAGVRVELLDPAEPQARALINQLEALNRPFLHRHREGRVLVTLKCALSLDGKLATRTGDSKWITTARTRRYAHRMRAEHGSVLVGVGTVLKDNPQLTVRLPGVRSQPIRIVLDTHLRTPLEAQVLDTRSAPTLLVCAQPMPP
ncbi:MAG: bifunctional diaminohydroxyphosphoribosylaminopyrimidine deaminase/5-amino-6-(5-phosphoribosylamino)uracil reductase RibD, partial [Armatimonadota bacterium]